MHNMHNYIDINSNMSIYITEKLICCIDHIESNITSPADLLNASKDMRGANGTLHFELADWNGQKPVVNTRTNRSTPCRLV